MVSVPTSNKNLSKGVSLGDDLPRGNILDHLGKLTPSKGGKYICPVCDGNDLSIATKGKSAGALTCHNNGCSWQSIMDVIAPLEKRGGKKPINGAATKRGQPRKFSTASDKDRAAAWAEIGIEARVTEIFYEVECGTSTPAEANIALSAWCKEHGHNAFAAGQLLKEKIKSLKNNSSWDDDEMVPVLLRDYHKIEDKFGDRLRFNQLFKRVELDGEVFEPSMAKIELIVAHSLKLKSARDDVADCVTRIARQNSYHPVKDYLQTCWENYGEDTTILNNFADRYFGTSAHIHQVATIKFLIAAVARAYEPGCQADNALILQGGQGIRKSTFFRELASPEWFDDSFGNASDKDERLKLHCAWILEWAELETIFKRKDVAAVKAFITTKIDRLRPPYGRVVEFMNRSSIFCGTTNQQDFLSDGTGNRRFWVVPATKEIPTDTLIKERDRIWAAATQLYKSGVAWHLTPEENAAMSESRTAYESADVWEDTIADWLEGHTVTTITEILSDLLRIETNIQDRRSQMRVRDVLIRLNWSPAANPRIYKGTRSRVWEKI